jgi:hypothetical protein
MNNPETAEFLGGLEGTDVTPRLIVEGFLVSI